MCASEASPRAAAAPAVGFPPGGVVGCPPALCRVFRPAALCCLQSQRRESPCLHQFVGSLFFFPHSIADSHWWLPLETHRMGKSLFPDMPWFEQKTNQAKKKKKTKSPILALCLEQLVLTCLLSCCTNLSSDISGCNSSPLFNTCMSERMADLTPSPTFSNPDSDITEPADEQHEGQEEEEEEAEDLEEDIFPECPLCDGRDPFYDRSPLFSLVGRLVRF